MVYFIFIWITPACVWCCDASTFTEHENHQTSSCSKHSRRFTDLEACFLLVTIVFFLFLFDKFRLKHLLKAVVNRKYPRIPVFLYFR